MQHASGSTQQRVSFYARHPRQQGMQHVHVDNDTMGCHQVTAAVVWCLGVRCLRSVVEQQQQQPHLDYAIQQLQHIAADTSLDTLGGSKSKRCNCNLRSSSSTLIVAFGHSSTFRLTGH